jgi:hypothetical protein
MGVTLSTQPFATRFLPEILAATHFVLPLPQDTPADKRRSLRIPAWYPGNGVGHWDFALGANEFTG